MAGRPSPGTPVSIRSPRRNEGRPAHGRASGHIPMFQSAPPVETRGDGFERLRFLGRSGFNPLPPSKRGETSTPKLHMRIGRVSIRSPRRNEGRPQVVNASQTVILVSIRSPRRNEGRQLH